jgi:predicted RNA-binding Zn-ribbon protein involved in translation (DUF1610 family)
MKTKPKDKDEKYNSKNKQSDEMFCYSCGSIVKINSSICPKCGVSQNYISLSREKEKETAILLAIFTSFFTWLYLYEKNYIKFWTALGVFIISIIFAKYFFYLSFNYWYMTLLPCIIIWIFAILDISFKDKKYYESFGGK